MPPTKKKYLSSRQNKLDKTNSKRTPRSPKPLEANLKQPKKEPEKGTSIEDTTNKKITFEDAHKQQTTEDVGCLVQSEVSSTKTKCPTEECSTSRDGATIASPNTPPKLDRQQVINEPSTSLAYNSRQHDEENTDSDCHIVYQDQLLKISPVSAEARSSDQQRQSNNNNNTACRLIIQSSSSSSVVSTYGTTSEAVIERTLQKLNRNSSSQAILIDEGQTIGMAIKSENNNNEAARNKHNVSELVTPVIGSIKSPEQVNESASRNTNAKIGSFFTRTNHHQRKATPATDQHHGRNFDDAVDDKRDYFARQPLFSSMTLSNEFHLITSSDMRINYEQQQLINNNQAKPTKYNNSYGSTANRIRIDQDYTQDSCFNGQHRQTGPSHRNKNSYYYAKNKILFYMAEACCLNRLRPIILGCIIVLCFALTTFAHRHFDGANEVAWSAIVVIIMNIMIIFELVHRTLAAIIGAVLAITLYSCLKEVPDLEEIITWVNIETISLLFGMMIIVAVLSETGIFNYLAIWSYKKARGRFWLLLAMMYIITAVLSAFIDNVSTMLFMAPIVIRLSDLQQIDPRLILMILIVVSNIGGLATPVGDPPNIIVISDEVIQLQGVNFLDFVYICTPAVIIIMLVSFMYIRIRYSNLSNFKHDRPHAVVVSEQTVTNGDVMNSKEIEHEIDIWTKIQFQLPKLTKDHATVGLHINQQINQLRTCLNKRLYYEDPMECHGGHGVGIVQDPFCIDDQQVGRGPTNYKHLPRLNAEQRNHQSQTMRNHNLNAIFERTVNELEDKYAIKDYKKLLAPLLVLIITIVLFFLQSFPYFHLNSLAWISMFAAVALLAFTCSSKIESSRPEESNESGSATLETDYFESILSKVEWATLIFFAALFIVMEVVSKLGLIMYIGQKIMLMINLLPNGSIRSLGAITIVLWSSGIASGFIDNVPFTAMMVKILSAIIIEQQQQHQQTMMPVSSSMDNLEAHPTESLLPIKGMIFALIFGACLGGNATLIGASANLVTAGVAQRFGYPIGFVQFLRFALPVTVLSMVIANAYLLMVFQFIIPNN